MNKKHYIEKLFKNKPIMLAPMAGYTDIGFRYLCKKYGADVVFTEMINVSALCYKNKKTFDMLQFLSDEKPIAVQLFGNNPEKFKKAVGLISDYDFDIIDINMGCPAPKIVKNKVSPPLRYVHEMFVLLSYRRDKNRIFGLVGLAR